MSPRSWHLVSALVGMAIWLMAAAWIRPSPYDVAWGRLILLLATLVLFPLGLRLAADAVEFGRGFVGLQFASAVLLGLAFLFPQGGTAAALAGPWLLTTVLTACLSAWQWRKNFRRPQHQHGIFAALVFVSVGGVWALLDRLGARPLNFEPVIVLLTAIHFHYAGFLLPLFTGLAARKFPGRFSGLTLVAVLAGVPLVAAGITSTQLGLGSALEIVAVIVTVIGGAACGAIHLRLAADRRQPWFVRLAWTIVGLTLFGSLALAACYGLRSVWPIRGLDIPTMRAWHGTANAIGFGLVGVIGWILRRRDESP